MPKATLASAQTDSLSSADRTRKVAKLGAEHLTSDEQRRRFIEAAREAGASESETEFDIALGAIFKPQGEQRSE